MFTSDFWKFSREFRSNFQTLFHSILDLNMVVDAHINTADCSDRSITNTQKNYPLEFNLGTPYEIWICVFIKQIYLKTAMNFMLSVTGAIMPDNKTQELLQPLVKFDALDERL